MHDGLNVACKSRVPTCKASTCTLKPSSKVQGFSYSQFCNVIVCLAYVGRSPSNLKFVKPVAVVSDTTSLLKVDSEDVLRGSRFFDPVD